jgi:hypothetical protein
MSGSVCSANGEMGCRLANHHAALLGNNKRRVPGNLLREIRIGPAFTWLRAGDLLVVLGSMNVVLATIKMLASNGIEYQSNVNDTEC